MNRAASLAIGLLLCGALTSGAWAQDFSGMQPEPPTPGLGSIPSTGVGGGLSVEIKNAADASAYQDKITDFVKAQVAKVGDNENPADQRTARDLLVRECTPGSTTSYLSIYANQVNSAVMALLDKPQPPPLRVRLNLAVLVESIAHTTRDASLRPTVSKLVADPAEPIALWGIRAARALLVPSAQQNAATADPLVAQVVASVKAHEKFGILTEEGYRTLALDGEGVTMSAVPNTLLNSIHAMLDIMTFRIGIYQKAIADNPEAEDVAARFFSANSGNLNANGNTAELHAVVQALSNLITVVGAQSGGASRPVLEQLVGCLKIAAQSLSVITKPPDGAPLSRLIHLVAGTGGDPITQLTAAVYPELKADPQFGAFVKPPPTVVPVTRPSTTQHHASTPAPMARTPVGTPPPQ